MTIKIRVNTMYFLDKQGVLRLTENDTTKAPLRLALCDKDYQRSHLCGQAISSYHQQDGYPTKAFHFIQTASAGVLHNIVKPGPEPGKHDQTWLHCR
jgi:hypothetical protein